MSDSKNIDLEKTLSLKIQEIESLKAQNGRLIQKLQEEIDKSATAVIQKEIIHKEILQIHMTLREVYQQSQTKKSVLEKIFNKIGDFELRIQEQQRTAAGTYGKQVASAISDEMEQLKLEVLKIQSKETNIEKLLIDTNEQLQEQRNQIKATQLAIDTILRKMLNTSNNGIQSAIVSPVSDDTIKINNNSEESPSNKLSESDLEKISRELKNELGRNKEDLNLILQMLNEK